MNLYQYARSNPTRFTDPFGLDTVTMDSGSRGPKQYMQPLLGAKLRSYQGSYGRYRFWTLTGLDRAIDKMRMATNRVEYQDATSGGWGTFILWLNEANASYDPIFNAVYASPSASRETVFHEFTHALQDLGPGRKSHARDEGEAWAAQLQLDKLFWMAKFENELDSGRDCKTLRDGWRQLWSRNFGFPSIIGFPTGEGSVNAVDVRAASTLTGFGVRCRALADAYNSVIHEVGLDRAPCCLKLTCNSPMNGQAVGPDHVLNTVWR